MRIRFYKILFLPPENCQNDIARYATRPFNSVAEDEAHLFAKSQFILNGSRN